MKKLLIGLGTFALAAAMTAAAQDQAQPAPGLGRGGAPRAFGDLNKDGICDRTGKPVGQGRAQAMQGRAGRRAGRIGMGFRGGWNAAPAAPEVKQ